MTKSKIVYREPVTYLSKIVYQGDCAYVAIPDEISNELKLKEGQEIDVEILPSGSILIVVYPSDVEG